MFLLSSRRFLPLFLTQFLGAFNDNLFKNALIILITYKLTTIEGQSPQELVTIAAGLFILPFFLFSALAGQIADKYNRDKIAQLIKIFEIIIMILAGIGFITQNIPYLIAILFACGVHSAFFGPIKYALLPQHLHPDELLKGNGYVEAGTFIAILVGTISGGIFIILENGTYLLTTALLCIAVFGYIASTYIPSSPAPVPNLKINLNIVQETGRIIINIRKQNLVFAAVMCVSWFWFIGATFLTLMPNLVKNQLHAEAEVVGLFLTIFSIGISVGSIICNKILNNAIKPWLVPIAAIGMSILITDLYFACKSEVFFNLHGLLSIQRFIHFFASWRIIIDLFGIAVFGGLYIVPLYSLVQYYGDKKHMARIIAANNIFNALFMVLSALLILLLSAMSFNIPTILLIVGILNLIMTAYVYLALCR